MIADIVLVNFFLQLIESKFVWQIAKQPMRYLAACPHLLEFQPEQVPVVAWIRMDFGGAHVVAQGIKIHVVVLIDNPATKFDGRDVAFTDNTKAHDEATGPFRIRFLTWNLDHRGVEQGRCLHGVFGSKIRPDQKLLLFGQFVAIRYVVNHPVEISFQCFSEIAVTVREVVQNGFQ